MSTPPPNPTVVREPIRTGRISIEKLSLDLENPRLPVGRRNKGEKAAVDFLIRKGNVLEIMESIAQNDFYPAEPLLVSPRESLLEEYTVVEGNCRLAACKLLLNPSLTTSQSKSIRSIIENAKFKPTELPCLVFASRAEILPQLGFRHITGVTEWSPLQKARFFQQIKDQRSLGSDISDYKLMAQEFGSGDRWDYVAGSLTTLRLFEHIENRDFFDIPGLDEEKLNFSVLNTALNYESICKFLGLKDRRDEEGAVNVNPQHIEELTRWLFEKSESGRPRVPESRELKSLAAVVASDRALKKFREGTTLHIAVKLTSLPRETVNTLIDEARNALHTAYEIAEQVETFDPADIKVVENLSSQTLRSLHAVMSDKVASKDPFKLG
ncbi:MAG: hypothetical protein RLY86_1940 [Pseudomonadota bacterium]|jgi:hypothetical protein